MEAAGLERVDWRARVKQMGGWGRVRLGGQNLISVVVYKSQHFPAGVLLGGHSPGLSLVWGKIHQWHGGGGEGAGSGGLPGAPPSSLTACSLLHSLSAPLPYY